ncbi:MAG: hypothetical protein FJ297_06230 [Planctomycetes bacterium]|nr:hypothetical protein [Planctomycetota bacterium]
MCPSMSFRNPVLTTQDAPIRVRYPLHAHAGAADRDRAASIAHAFSESPPWTVSTSTAPHTAFTIDRRA